MDSRDLRLPDFLRMRFLARAARVPVYLDR